MNDSSVTKPGSMIFVDKCLADDLINVIEKMVNYHIDKNYKEVRNIIIGYDSKNGEWKSRYGESLEKKISESEQTISYTTSSVCSFFLNTENFTKQGMTFYEDEIYSNVRLQLDESMKRVLDVMFTHSDKVIEYRHIIDIIITEWNLKNIDDSITPIKTKADPDICGNLYFHQLEVRESAWREFRSISRHKGLMIKDAFKLAIIGFLEDRAEMLRDITKDIIN